MMRVIKKGLKGSGFPNNRGVSVVQGEVEGRFESAFMLSMAIIICFFWVPAFGQDPIKKQNQKLKLENERAVPNQLIIKWKDRAFNHRAQSLSFVGHQVFGQELKVIHEFRSNGAQLIEWSGRPAETGSPQSANFQDGISGSPANGGFSIMALAKQLEDFDDIEYAEPNYYVHALGAETAPTPSAQKGTSPNDPEFGRQRGLTPVSDRGGGRRDIQVEKAWSYTLGHPSTVIAVIDTGVDYNHEDLKANIWTNLGESGLDARGRSKTSNGIDDDNNGFVDDFRGWDFANNDNDPMDDNGHGTHCAGTIGAVGDNGVGIAGINWKSSILPIKFLDRKGTATVAQGALAIEYATALGIPILNNSWGGDEYSETVAAAIRKAHEKNILFVVAAGNETNNIDLGPMYPASYDFENVIAVAALDGNNEVAYFSNFGPKTVAIAAPGEEIVSTLPNNSYGPMEGTSMATPFVAGAAGLLKSMYPQLQGVQLKDRLLLTAVDRERLSKQVLFGRLSLTRLMEDRFAPAMPVPSIAVSDVGKSFLRLKGSGLDGFKGYEVRWSESPFDSEKKWEESRRLLKSVEPFSGNASQVLKISGFPINAKGFIGLRFWDELGNRTPLDQGEKFSLLPMDFFYEVLPDQNEGVDFLGGWGREKVVGRGVVFSDSPNGVYGYERENHFELPPIQVPNDEMVLAFECKFDFELGFDFGELAVSQDKGETWKVIQRWTGSQNWHTETLPLKDFLRSSAPALLRFRTLSDRTTSKDGWQISRIQGWK